MQRLSNRTLYNIVARLITLAAITASIGCNTGNSKERSNNSIPDPIATTNIDSTSFAEKDIPILCYHQVREWKNTDSKSERVYILPVAAFDAQIKMLHDSGYNTILPDQLIAYLQKRSKLPDHPILITFDDATQSQYSNALPQLDKAGFKAVYFIMTVVLNKPDYMTRQEVAELSRRGHVIGCHTWDHRNVKEYKEQDWITEVEKPTSELEQITGKPIKYFAYPFGMWDDAAVGRLKKYNFTAAFQLWGKNDKEQPLYTMRRILVSGYWGTKDLLNAIHRVEQRRDDMLASTSR